MENFYLEYKESQGTETKNCTPENTGKKREKTADDAATEHRTIVYA